MIKNLTTKMLRYFLLGIMVASSILVYAGDANPSGDAAGAGKPTKMLDGFGDMMDLLEPHNTPIGLSYDFAGGVGLEFALDNVAYKRDVDNVSNVSMNLRAAFTLPFSVSKGKTGVSQIVFRGEDIVLRGKGSSKIFLDVPDNKKLEYARYELCEGKCYMCVSKESYMEIDCDGFKHMRLKGKFEFSSDVIYPATKSQKQNDPAKTDTPSTTADASKSDADANDSGKKTPEEKAEDLVAAEFDVEISNLSDIIIVAGFEKPFKVKCTGDIIYEVHGLTADLSSVRNAAGFEFPSCYTPPMPDNPETWTGFAMNALKVDLKQQFPDLPFSSAEVKTMLIDETGVSGWFSVNYDKNKQKENDNAVVNKDNTTNGTTADAGDSEGASSETANKGNNSVEENNLIDNSVLGVSLTKLSLGVASSKIVGGGIEGDVTVKPLKDKNEQSLCVKLEGKFYSQNDELGMNIKASMAKDAQYNLPFLKDKATVTIGAGTYISYDKTPATATTPEKKGFTFNLTGGIDLETSVLKMEGLTFENMRFSTNSPHFNGGNFALKSMEPFHLGGLSFALMDLKFGYDGEQKLISMGAGVKLELIEKKKADNKEEEKDKEGASVTAGFTMTMQKEADNPDAEGKWKAKDLQIDSIRIKIDYSAFKLNGRIGIYRDDEVYGKGFHGLIGFEIVPISLGVSAEARFGKIDKEIASGTERLKYRYWYARASVDKFPPGILVFPPGVFLRSVSFAAYSKMNFTKDLQTTGVTTNYFPDPNVKFGFEGGIGVYVGNPKLVNASVFLGMQFNPDGGLNNITLDGTVSAMSDDPKNAYIKGALRSEYNFIEHIFDMNAQIEFTAKVLTGKVPFELHTEPKKWHLHIGTNEVPVELKFAKIAKVSCYFMLGEVPSQLPPLNPALTSLFGVVKSEAANPENVDLLKNGSGFAFGASVDIDCGPDKFIYADVKLKGGTDALIVRRDSFMCGGSDFRGSGRTYVYLALGAGISFRDKHHEFLDIQAGASLQAEFPKPYHIAGEFGFRFRLLHGLIKGDADAWFDAGESCKWERVLFPPSNSAATKKN